MTALPGAGELARIAESIPVLAGRALDLEPLPGLTNRSFKIAAGTDSFVLRLPGSGTGAYIDRAAEIGNTAKAAALGLAPEVLWSDPERGLLLTRFVAGVPLAPDELRCDSVLVGQVASLLHRLHRSGADFAGTMELFPKLDDYLALIRQRDPRRLGALPSARRAAEPIRHALAASPEALVPSHIDPTPANFLQAGDRLLLIDWEYSAMCDPLWDLAGFSVEAALTPAQDEVLLATYFGDGAPDRRARFALFKPMLDLLSAAWAALQIVSGNAGPEFQAYADGRLARSGLISL